MRNAAELRSYRYELLLIYSVIARHIKGCVAMTKECGSSQTQPAL